jgi:hypothetical protein
VKPLACAAAETPPTTLLTAQGRLRGMRNLGEGGVGYCEQVGKQLKNNIEENNKFI